MHTRALRTRLIPLSAAAAMTLLLAAASLLGGTAARAQTNENKALVSGWYQNRAAQYYDFGANTPLAGASGVPTAPIYVFITGMNADGTPRMVEGQHNIVDVLPGDAGYSDLWQVNFVTVPAGYVADTARSKADIDAAGYAVTPTDTLVNCPIVPAGTTLAGGEPLVQGWARGQEVFYPDFGQNSATAAPIWVFIHGMNADGTPQMVEGQSNIIDTIPGDAGYTAFWNVNFVTVPAGYVPNSIRSAADVRAAGYTITPTTTVVNCPVIAVASAATASTLPATGDGALAASDGGPDWALFAAIGGGALLVSGGAVATIRRRTSR